MKPLFQGKSHIVATLLSSILFAMLLSSCGGGDSSAVETPPPAPLPAIGQLSLAITDAPVDNAVVVNVQFDGIEVKPKSGNSISFTFDPLDIDLLSLQGGGSQLILDDVSVAAGEYTWIRMNVIAEKDVIDSYLQTIVDDPASQTSLWVPSGNSSGLKLNGPFIVPAGGSADLTIDFDLRKSIVSSPGDPNNFKLKPVLRIVDNSVVGEITGIVDASLVEAANCSESSAVYIFAADVLVEDVDDIDLADDGDLGGADPVSSANVEQAQDGVYQYSASFLSAADYTIAFTCHASNDEVEVDNSLAGEAIVEFRGATVITVNAGQNTVHDFIDSSAP